MQTVTIFIITAIVIGIIVIAVRSNDAKMQKLVDEGKAAKRERTFWMKQTLFSTSVSSIAEVYSAMDKSVLNEVDIHHNIESDSYVLFTQKVSGGSFAATLRTVGQSDGKQHYTYNIDQYHGPDGYMNLKCLRAANILLTAIEKAFLQLDKDISVSRRTATLQTK